MLKCFQQCLGDRGEFLINIFVKSDNVYIRTIDRAKLPMIYSIYKEVEPFLCLAKDESKLDFNSFTNMYKETIRASTNFFIGIFQVCDDKLIGFLKGRIQPSEGSIWINIMALGEKYRGKGHGSEVFKLFCNMEILGSKVDTFYLAVRADNESGLNFWTTNKFEQINEMNSGSSNNNSTNHERYCTQPNIIIMRRKLKNL